MSQVNCVRCGKTGEQLAKPPLRNELGTRVHLDLSVRVRRSWRGDDALLDRLGIT